MKSLVSVIIPTLNRLQYITQTIKSVTEQTYTDLEIIVSDNGSSCDVRTHINYFLENDARIIFRRNETTVTMPQHFNQCLALAKGEYIIYISDDDLISNSFVQNMVEAFEADSAVTIGVSETKIIDVDGTVVSSVAAPAWNIANGRDFVYSWLLNNEKIPVASFISLFAKREAVKQFGGFPEFEAGAHIDNAVAINLCLTGNIVYVSNAIFFYREYIANFGLSMPLKKLAKASKQFIYYYQSKRNQLINTNGVNFDQLITGIKKLSFETYAYRALSLKKINALKAFISYGLGYHEFRFLIQKVLKKAL